MDTILSSKQNKYVFMLFYASNGASINRDINMKYELFYQEYKFSRVQFGKVDIHTDRDYADRWLQPNEIPTHIMWKNGTPVRIEEK